MTIFGPHLKTLKVLKWGILNINDSAIILSDCKPKAKEQSILDRVKAFEFIFSPFLLTCNLDDYYA